MVVIIGNEARLFQTQAIYYILEKRDRYEINSEAVSEEDQLRDIRLLYQWLRSLRDGYVKKQVFASDAGAETIYLLKGPRKIILEQDSPSLQLGR